MVHPEPEHDHTAQPAAGKAHAKLCSLTRNHYIHRRRTGRAGDREYAWKFLLPLWQ